MFMYDTYLKGGCARKVRKNYSGINFKMLQFQIEKITIHTVANKFIRAVVIGHKIAK